MPRTYAALMLEGPQRGKVIVAQGSVISFPVAMMNPGIQLPWDVAFQRITFEVNKMNLFGVIVKVWVPGHIRTPEGKDVWALNRLIDEKLHSGLVEVSEVPAEWMKPAETVHVNTERQRELGA